MLERSKITEIVFIESETLKEETVKESTNGEDSVVGKIKDFKLFQFVKSFHCCNHIILQEEVLKLTEMIQILYFLF